VHPMPPNTELLAAGHLTLRATRRECHTDGGVPVKPEVVGLKARQQPCQLPACRTHPATVEEMLAPTLSRSWCLLLSSSIEYRCQLHMYQWLLLQHSVRQGQTLHGTHL
jgi:hypothetical protein